MASIVLDKSKRPLVWIGGLVAGGLTLLGVMTYRMVQTPANLVELEKMTVLAQRQPLAVEIEASGKVQPIQSVNISPKNPGVLKRLLVEQGMQVKQGQPLAVMDNLEIRAQGLQAEAKFREALANLEAAKRRIPEEIRQYQTRLAQAQARFKGIESQYQRAQQRIPKDVEQARAQVQAAEARFRLAENRVKRNDSLVREGAISQDQFDEVLNEYLSAKASLNEAVQRLEQVNNTASPEMTGIQQEGVEAQAAIAEAKFILDQRLKTQATEIAQLESAAAAARAELERIKIQYQDTVIAAPFNGIVTQKYATEGSFVTPTTSASETASATSSSIIALARGLEVVAKVPEVDISLLRPGQPVKVVADAYPDQVFQGQVLRIAPEAIVEENVTSFEVTIGLITGLDKLLSRMNVDVTFIGQQISDALVVPTVAIVTQEGQTGVMVPNEEKKPEFKPVTVGLVLDDRTQILSGVNPGDRVFIDLPEDQKDQDKNK
jgi:HlyD family secretion protein